MSQTTLFAETVPAVKLKPKNEKIIGEVIEVIPNFFAKKGGTPIPAIRLRFAKLPFVDWKRKILEMPKIGEDVWLKYERWIPPPRAKRLEGVGPHNSIYGFRNITKNPLSIEEILKSDKRRHQ